MLDGIYLLLLLPLVYLLLTVCLLSQLAALQPTAFSVQVAITFGLSSNTNKHVNFSLGRCVLILRRFGIALLVSPRVHRINVAVKRQLLFPPSHLIAHHRGVNVDKDKFSLSVIIKHS